VTRVHFYCSAIEKRYVVSSARQKGMAISSYLRAIAMQGFVDKDKTLPSEVLAFSGELQHVSGLLDTIARKRLDGEDLNALDRAELSAAKGSIQGIVEQIKNYLS
jgi:hypothetical protein